MTTLSTERAPIADAIRTAVEHRPLPYRTAHAAAEAIMDGEASPAQIAALLVSLRMKGETVDEIRGFVTAMRARAAKIEAPANVVDPCGTGGDGLGTFNVSTAAAFVAAAAGCPIAKHGNRSVSSRCGSAEVLDAMGIDSAPGPERASRQLRLHGLCFLFAPRYHQATRHAAVPRREIGVRSIFNLVGPLTNPAGAKRQLIGVFEARWTEPLARVLQELGSEHCLVVHGQDGLDEISIGAETQVSELRDGRIETWRFDPRELGFRLQPLDRIRGGNPEDNAKILLLLLDGERGAARDIVLLNAGATLYVGGLAGSIEDGVTRAARAIDSGAARRLMEAMRCDA